VLRGLCLGSVAGWGFVWDVQIVAQCDSGGVPAFFSLGGWLGGGIGVLGGWCGGVGFKVLSGGHFGVGERGVRSLSWGFVALCCNGGRFSWWGWSPVLALCPVWLLCWDGRQVYWRSVFVSVIFCWVGEISSAGGRLKDGGAFLAGVACRVESCLRWGVWAVVWVFGGTGVVCCIGGFCCRWGEFFSAVCLGTGSEINWFGSGACGGPVYLEGFSGAWGCVFGVGWAGGDMVICTARAQGGQGCSKRWQEG